MPLTADLCARAFIAAARAAGTDPILAAEAPPGSRRLVIRIATASALARTGTCPADQASRVFGIATQSIYGARSKAANPGAKGGHSPEAAAAFLKAELAAARAIEFATWQPDAAASVVGGAGPDEVGAAMLPPGPVAATAPPAEPRRRLPTAGRVTSWMQQGLAPAPSSLPPLERPLRDRILEVLADGTASAPGLATLLDAKELTVSQSLSVLLQDGLVEAGEIPPEGVRHRRWSAVVRAAA